MNAVSSFPFALISYESIHLVNASSNIIFALLLIIHAVPCGNICCPFRITGGMFNAMPADAINVFI